MKLLVISDLHRRRSNFERVMEKHPDIIRVVFLGDGADDVAEMSAFYPDKVFHILSGNCDFLSKYPSTIFLNFEGVKILATHGHGYGVKGSTDHLRAAAEREGVTLALYGHTHIQREEYCDGIYLVCPGALGNSSNGPGYAIIDITPQGIMPNLIKL